MKMTKKTNSFIALLLFATTFNTYSMEPQPSKWAAVVGDVILGTANMTILSQPNEPFEFTVLPLEMQYQIIQLLASNETASSLQEAAKTINFLAQVNHELNELINDPNFCLQLIKRLAQRFSCSEQEVAEVLQTKEAKQRLEIQKQFLTLCQRENFNKEEFDLLYEKYKQYIDLNFTFIIFNPNQEKNEITLLIQAALNNNCLAIQTILKYGANINKATYSKVGTALMFAIPKKNIDAIQCLLKNRNIAIDQQDNTGTTALMIATMINNCPIIQTLLNHGANINKATNQGLTALMFAVANKHTDALQCLLNNPDITINQEDDTGGTALLIAIELNNCPFIQILLHCLMALSVGKVCFAGRFFRHTPPAYLPWRCSWESLS